MTDRRDPHLLAALRHAPDRDLAPPPELSARILDAARDAVRPTASPLQRWIAWLTRPQVGAAFATLAVATLVGVLWSTQEVPLPVSVSPEVPESAKRDEREEAATAPATAAQRVPTPAAPAPASSERRLAKKSEAVAPMPPARDSAPESKVLAETVPSAAALPAAPPAEALGRADAARPPSPPAAPGQRLRNESPAANQQAGALDAAQPAAAAPMRAAQAAAYDPLMALDARDARAWVWVAGGVEHAHGAAQREWWATLRAATQGRWDAAPSAPPSPPWLVLRDGAQQSLFRLANGALHVTDAESRTWWAPVTPEQARDWQQAVSRW